MGDPRTLKVSVVHCDLRQANYPLAVGHYRQDVIVNAEAELDAALGGVLRQRFDLGVYPGEIGTSEFFLHGPRPPGAIVIGLGPVGELTAEGLRHVFAMALSRYALTVSESNIGGATPRSGALPFSTLLIGAEAGALLGVRE